jgi:hypothetical protein
MSDLNRPLLGEPNAPCRTCGAPLAEDQRYCLECGTRRAEARLPFLDILARQVPAAAVAETTTVARRRRPAWPADMNASSTAVAGVACLLLALGLGLLIGSWGNGDSASAGRPQVISVGGGAVAPAAAAAAPVSSTAPASTTAPGTTAPPTKDKKKSSSSSSGASKATNSAVKSLDGTSGSDYSKKSSKLPKTLGTGGKAPPVDKSGTKIGAGSDVTSIG